MPTPALDEPLALTIRQMRENLAEAHSIAKVAEICLQDGQVQRAMHIVLDAESLIRTADHLLQAAAAISRRNSLRLLTMIITANLIDQSKNLYSVTLPPVEGSELPSTG